MHLENCRMVSRWMAIALLLLTLCDIRYMSAQTSASHPATESKEQDARPPVTKMDLRIAKRARALLKSESTWNRADRPHIEGDQTTACQTSAKQMSLYCALERATLEVSGQFEHRGAVMQEARVVIENTEPNWETKYQHLLVDYNNDPHTTFQDIQRVLQSVEQRIAGRLQDKD
jgi:hypothetical protein